MMHYPLNSTTPEPDRSLIVGRAYADHYAAVVGYFRRRLNTTTDVEDLVQDVFMRLLEYSGRIRENTLQFFVFAIARSVLYDHLRHHCCRRNILLEAFPDSIATSEEPENRIIARDMAEMEHREICRLPPQRKTIYLLWRFSEQRPDDIARDMALSRRTVENHIFTARQTIRRVMERHCC